MLFYTANLLAMDFLFYQLYYHHDLRIPDSIFTF